MVIKRFPDPDISKVNDTDRASFLAQSQTLIDSVSVEDPSSIQANSVATMAVTGISDEYENFLVRLRGVRPMTTSANLNCVMELNTPGNFSTQFYFYHLSYPGSISAAYAGRIYANAPSIEMAYNVANQEYQGADLDIMIPRKTGGSVRYPRLWWNGCSLNNTNTDIENISGSAYHKANYVDLRGLRFNYHNGNMFGDIKLYGLGPKKEG